MAQAETDVQASESAGMTLAEAEAEVEQLRIQINADNGAISRLVARQRAELRRAAAPSQRRKERLRHLELAIWRATHDRAGEGGS